MYESFKSVKNKKKYYVAYIEALTFVIFFFFIAVNNARNKILRCLK